MRSFRPYSWSEIHTLFTSDSDSTSAVRFIVAIDTKPVGVVGYSIEDETTGIAEPSCWSHPAHSGEGYGTAAVELLLEYGFDQCRLHKFVAEVIEFNEAAKATRGESRLREGGDNGTKISSTGCTTTVWCMDSSIRSGGKNSEIRKLSPVGLASGFQSQA